MPRKYPAPTVQQNDNRSERGDFFITQPAWLQLADGSKFAARLPKSSAASLTKPVHGEVVFNTGMTGYVESLTDPSYRGQILVFTYPLIGNYGSHRAYQESDRIQVAGVIVSTLAGNWSHAAAERSLLAWLEAQQIPVLFNVDTRRLTRHLRSQGTMMGALTASTRKVSPLKPQQHFVSINQPIIYNRRKKKKIILVDCGLKENILRELQQLPVQIKRVPHTYDYTQESYDGVLVSNGPGNPQAYRAAIAHLNKAMRRGKPLFGICLGSQLMGLAAGAKTYKLRFGHRGHNQPCLDTSTNRAYITSQNHGYAIREQSLPGGWRVLFRNLNDQSVEGIEHRDKPFFAVQFHPEAAPGPTDTHWLFERFYRSL